MAANPTAPASAVSGFEALSNSQFMSLTTFRKNGQGVSTPVWFAALNGTLYVQTQPTTGKVKRLRHTARVTVAPSTQGGKVTGPLAEGTAQLLTDAPEIARAEAALAQKYKMMRVMFNGILRLRGAISRKPMQRVYLAISAA